MSVITINLTKEYFADVLGAEASALVPEAVVRDAESNLESYLRNHSEEFWTALATAIEKAVDNNTDALVEAGAVKPDGDDEASDDDETPQ